MQPLSRHGYRKSSSVKALAEDSRGRLWIGSDGGVDLLVDGKLVKLPEPVRAQISFATVQIYIDRTDTVWIGTDHGLFALNEALHSN